jgi:hypothetical protein
MAIEVFHGRPFETHARLFRRLPNEHFEGRRVSSELIFECDHTCSASAELRSEHIGSRLIYREG